MKDRTCLNLKGWNMKLFTHQIEGLKAVENRDHVAFYWDMGLGKTFAGSEKIVQLGARMNLVVCQKSKIEDWLNHFIENYYDRPCIALDLTKNANMKLFLDNEFCSMKFGVINYDLVWRRPELLKLKNFTLLLDESSLIQNETTKRSKFILKLQPKNVILLSGTPTGGKYEKLWSQMHLLGWGISKQLYWKQFVNVEYLDVMEGKSIPIVKGYKNVERLKRKMADYGCQFLKTDDVFDLPSQMIQQVKVPAIKEYRTFRKDRVITLDDFYNVENGTVLVGDTALTRMLYERQLCGQYNPDKLKAFTDLVESTDDRLVVFYNFTAELQQMIPVINESGRKISIVNGEIKSLKNYDTYSDSVTFVQYQAGAMGLNLQKANKIIYFTLPLSSELFEQSKKRIHRIGQDRPCFYYILMCRNSIEERILKTLEMRQDYTEKLFEKDEQDGI